MTLVGKEVQSRLSKSGITDLSQAEFCLLHYGCCRWSFRAPSDYLSLIETLPNYVTLDVSRSGSR